MNNKKFLVVVTSQDHYKNSDVPTGLWLSELTHFWDVMKAAGHDMEIISTAGGKVPLEPKSLGWIAMDKSTKAHYENPEFMALLDNTKTAAEVNWADYDGIYYTGGHGVMWDFLDDEDLQTITRNLYEDGRIVSSVCHGYCGLLNVKLSNGDYLIKDKALTGFSWLEEILAGVAKKVPYNAEDIAKQRGAKYQKAFIPFVPRAETDGLLVTGQNPASAKKTAEQVVALLAHRS